MGWDVKIAVRSILKDGSHNLVLLDIDIQVHVINLHGSRAHYPLQSKDGAVHLGDEIFPSYGVSDGVCGKPETKDVVKKQFVQVKVVFKLGKEVQFLQRVVQVRPGGGGGSIAVHRSWIHLMSPKVNTFRIMMISRASIRASDVTSSNSETFSQMCWEMNWRARYVLMLVYLDMASAMNSIDPGGGGIHCDKLSLEIKAALEI
jgi:hypothetical protein